MLLFKQLDLDFSFASPVRGRDPKLESLARQLLQITGGGRLAHNLRVEWNARLRTAAGRADFKHNLVSLNPRLHGHGEEEIDRTLRHELAHLLAHFRGGRRRIAPHGPEWRQACIDLGIAGEARCHTLAFPSARRGRRFLYECPRCAEKFPRVRAIRRAVACLACCRKYYEGRFDRRLQLRLVK